MDLSTLTADVDNHRPFRCLHPGCGATYRRKEHLTRHAVRHSQSKIFTCEVCGNAFDRSDTLRRHKKVHTKEDEPSLPRVTRACNRCRSQKSRCDGQLPCSVCLKRGAACSFDRDGQASGQQRLQSVDERDGESSVDGSSHNHKRRRLDPSVLLQSPIQCRGDDRGTATSDISVPETESSTFMPVISTDPVDAKEQLLQHEELLRQEGMHLAPDTSTIPSRPQAEGAFSWDYLGDPARLGDGTTQPIDTAYYVSLYFAHFHPQWPFLHEQSFRHEHDPPVLVLAVVMIGLWMTGEARARRLAWKIHARSHALLEEQIANWNTSKQKAQEKPKWPMATYQSILLHIIFAMIGGTPDGEPNSSAILHRVRPTLACLIETCLAQGLFFYPTMLAQGRSDDPVIFSWTRIDEAKRFSLTLFKVSVLFSSIADEVRDNPHPHPHHRHHHHRNRPLSVSDLRFPLPDNGYLWGSRPIREWCRRRDLQLKDPAETEDQWISHIFEEARARGGRTEERRAWLRMGAWLGFMAGVEPG